MSDDNNQYDNNNQYYENYPPMTLGDWMITFLILFCIPCVNIVMIFIWAFGSDVNPSKKTFCQAVLIVIAIITVINLLIFMSSMMFMMSEIGHSHGQYGMISLLLH